MRLTGVSTGNALEASLGSIRGAGFPLATEESSRGRETCKTKTRRKGRIIAWRLEIALEQTAQLMHKDRPLGIRDRHGAD
jgi:hypothetical protein